MPAQQPPDSSTISFFRRQMREDALKALAQEEVQNYSWFGWKSWAIELAEHVLALTENEHDR